MRTKTLLVAVTALAAGLFTSQAAVTSANIVGYANVVMSGNGTFNAVANPFNMGVSNGINEVFGSSLPNGSVVSLWNGSTYVSYGYDNSIQDHANDWFTGGFDADIDNLPIVAPGTGSFVVLSGTGTATNTFSGPIVVNVGATNTLNFTANNFQFTANAVPYAGQADGTNVDLLMPDGSHLIQWDPVNNLFIDSGYDTSIQDHSNNWFTGGFDADLANPPSVKVGESFFIVPSGAYSWKQVLTPN